MAWFKKLSRINKIFLVFLPLALVSAACILLLSGHRILSNTPCGCGPPPAEAKGQYEADAAPPVFNNQPVDYQMAELRPELEELEKQSAVLGTTAEERRIDIDLSEQKLTAYEGDKIAHEFLVSTGKWAPTPTGEYRIWIKLRYTKMEGGKRGTGTYYYLPNVPYTQYFYKGFGLHGTYWHANFGEPMSHGCVNLSIPDAEKLFYWTSPPVTRGKNIFYPSRGYSGTKVVIHD